MSGARGSGLTERKEIAANQKGKITKRQQDRFGGIFWQKRQFWLGMAIAGMIPTLTMFIGSVSAFTSGRSDMGAWPIGLMAGTVAVFCVWPLLSLLTYLRWRRLDNAFEHEPISHGEGSVQWAGKRYRITLADGTKLDPVISPDLLPGRYVFYYLPGYRWLLSADPIGPRPGEDALDLLNRRLAQANRFQFEALPLNRMGRLAGSQAVRIIGRLLGSILLVLAGVALFLIYFMHEGGTIEAMWMILAIVAGMGAATVFVTRKTLSSVLDCIRGRVISSEGNVSKVWEEAVDDSASYYYELNGMVFSVNEAGYEALIQGLNYRLYYLPRSQKLVNMEASSNLT